MYGVWGDIRAMFVGFGLISRGNRWWERDLGLEWLCVLRWSKWAKADQCGTTAGQCGSVRTIAGQTRVEADPSGGTVAGRGGLVVIGICVVMGRLSELGV